MNIETTITEQGRRANRDRKQILSGLADLRALATGGYATVILVVGFAAFCAATGGAILGNIIFWSLK